MNTHVRIKRPGRALLSAAASVMILLASATQAQINVISVDCTPFVSPGFTSMGPSNTMGMSIQQVDMGGQFNVTEVTPQLFRNMTAAQLSTYDLIAVNNNPIRLGDNCIVGAGNGLGTAWQSVIGVQNGGRVVLSSHDAARFKIIITPGQAFFGQGTPGPGAEPFAADDLVRSAALWAGGGSSTGLMIFNDSARFGTVGGIGWDNPELNLPAAWGVTDSDQTGGNPTDGGYTDILAAFATHPIYQNLSDARFGVNTVSSFAANIADGSFHSVFATFNAAIFTPTEVVINAGVVDVGGFNFQSTLPGCNPCFIGSNTAAAGPDGTAVTLIRDEDFPPEVACVEGVNPGDKTIPRAGQNSPGQNEDGFYRLLAIDDNDPAPEIWVSDATGSGPFGPYSAGDTVKITESPGGVARAKPMAGAVVAHIKLNGDAVVTAVDAAGNAARTLCLVPPPPK